MHYRLEESPPRPIGVRRPGHGFRTAEAATEAIELKRTVNLLPI